MLLKLTHRFCVIVSTQKLTDFVEDWPEILIELRGNDQGDEVLDGWDHVFGLVDEVWGGLDGVEDDDEDHEFVDEEDEEFDVIKHEGEDVVKRDDIIVGEFWNA